MFHEVLLLALLFVTSIMLTAILGVPGSLIAMALLFILLKMKIIKEKHLSKLTPFLLAHIGFFFIPPAVKVVEASSQLEGVIGQWILILVLSNMMVMAVTGVVVQFVINSKEEQ